MWEAINNFLVAVDDKVWGVPLMVLIIAGGVLLTCRLGIVNTFCICYNNIIINRK